MPLDNVHSLHPGKHPETAGIYVCVVTTNHPHKNILASNIPFHPNKAAGVDRFDGSSMHSAYHFVHGHLLPIKLD